jgi:hypothetical protein
VTDDFPDVTDDREPALPDDAPLDPLPTEF